MSIRDCAVCVVVLFISSCSGSKPPDWFDPLPIHYVTAYMPYVEEVIIPETIYAGGEFPIKMRLSFAQNHSVVIGNIDRQLITGCGSMPWMGPDGMEWILGIDPWVYPQSEFSSQPTSYEVTIDMIPLQAGEYKLGVNTARTRELGGLSDTYEIGTGGGAMNEDVETRIYNFTVIERPEVAAH